MELPKHQPEIADNLMKIIYGTWFLSLILPTEGWTPGIVFLFIGWIGMFGANFAWLANMFILMAHIQMRAGYYLSSLRIGIFAFLVSLQSLFTKNIGIDITEKPVWGIGYYVWELSFVLLILFSYYLLRQQKKTLTGASLPLTSEISVPT